MSYFKTMFTVFVASLVTLLAPYQAPADGLRESGLEKASNNIVLQACAFDLRDVRLTGGPFEHAMQLDRQYLLSFDVDRLLHDFRKNAGLPSSAQPLGGWESPKCEVRGHFVGHYLSACALMYASTGDQHLKQKGDAVVAGFAECQTKLGSGYLSAYPETFLDRVETGQRVWAPYYVLHKVLAGLLDMYVYCGNRRALDVAKRFGDWIIARNDRLTDEQMQTMLGVEHGGMNEALANLYGFTGDRKYLKIAMRFNHMAVIGPASHRQDALTGLHANTQIPKFIGTARLYELTGDQWLKDASLFFWNSVVKERSYVIGGNSDHEHFSPKETLSQALSPTTTETCNTYNMLKLTRHLFCWDPKVEYADYYERALYNHILASQNPKTGMMCYFVPLQSGSSKAYNTPFDSFWCCTGTGIENHAKYGDSIYFHDGRDRLLVNLFIASVLDWKTKGVTLSQETRYPDEATSRLVIKCRQPVELAISIRHPSWSTSGFEIRVNGQKQPAGDQPGSFATVRREWRTGDTIDIRIPFELRIERFRDNPNRFATLHGPLVLCAEVEPDKPVPALVGSPKEMLTALKPVSGKPSTFVVSTNLFRTLGQLHNHALTRQGHGPGSLDHAVASNPAATLEERLQTCAHGAQKLQPEAFTLTPFYKMHDNRHYVVYWEALTPEQWKTRNAEYLAEQAELKELDRRTVDMVKPRDQQGESAHHLKGEHMAAGPFRSYNWRHAVDGGWFSWDLKVLPDQAQELHVLYWGSDVGNRVFDIMIDDVKVATQRLKNNKPGKFFRVVYPIGRAVTSDKLTVTVRFQAHPHATAGGVFEVRVLTRALSATKR